MKNNLRSHTASILTLRNGNHPVNKTRFLVALDARVCVSASMSMFMTLHMPEQRFMLCSQKQQHYDLATLNADNISITKNTVLLWTQIRVHR